jgi:hypothetical protein
LGFVRFSTILASNETKEVDRSKSKTAHAKKTIAIFILVLISRVARRSGLWRKISSHIGTHDIGNTEHAAISR